MSPHNLAGVMGTTGSRCRSPHALLAMILSCIAGYVTSHAINIIVNSYLRIQPGPSVTRTASKSGLILEMVIFAAPLEMIMVKGQDIQLRVLLIVKAMLHLILIQFIIIQSSGAKIK